MNKIAIIHEWYTTLGGSEKVIQQLLKIFPNADLFSLIDFLPINDREFLGGRKIKTSFLQKAPFISRTNYRTYLPLMPLAIEQLDLAGYDLIISNCHAVSKGVITGPDQLHIGYIHTPLRYAWDMQNEYLTNSRFHGLKGIFARLFLHYVRNWDFTAGYRPDRLVANSNFIARRIRKTYRRESHVIYPPVDTDYFTPGGPRENFYLAASRFVPYKRLDLVVSAFRDMPDRELVIIGDGPELLRLKPLFGNNITWLGFQPAEVLRDYLQRCRAFIFAAKEDFGIMPLEAQACGTPVIAFGEGGVAETVLGNGHGEQTGIFFKTQTAPALQAAVREFENQNIRAENCRANAERFSNRRFQEEFQSFVINAWKEFRPDFAEG